MPDDLGFMRHAISMARRAWGQTAPNPAVGCVLVKQEQVIASAHTAAGGRPHAETQALAQVGEHAKGCTAYVTLEPCAHYGHTPPCAEALVMAGVRRVVIACRDEDARVRGMGVQLLQAAGVEVVQAVAEAEALPLYAGFFSRIHHGLPEINLKIATSLDGKICFADGTSQWITGEQARAYAHLLRAEHEAILTGIGTVLADNPSLTCRLPGMAEHSPLRVVMDSRLRTPLTSRLVASAQDVPLLMYTLQASDEKHRPYREAGAEIVVLPEMTLECAARDLAVRGISRVLVEAGQGIASHALMSGLVTSLYWFRAPMVIGESGFAAFTGEALEGLAKGKWVSSVQHRQTLGKDVLDVYSVAEGL